jgi:sugar lactone lactonase YvrE
MATITTSPSPLKQNNAGTVEYSNPIIIPSPDHQYVLKNNGGSTVSTAYSGGNLNYFTNFPVDSLYPRGMTYDDDGNLYISTTSAGGSTPYITKLSPTGILIANYSDALLSKPYGIAYHNGIIYIVDNDTTDQIIAFDINTTFFTQFYDGSAGYLNNPIGITIDNTGQYLYVTNQTVGTGSPVTLGDYFITIIPIANPLTASIYYQSPTMLSNPDGIVFDSNDNLYIANRLQNTITGQYFITKMDASGLIPTNITTFYTTSNLNLLNFPLELAILNDYLYILNVAVSSTQSGFISAINLIGTPTATSVWTGPVGNQLGNIIFNNLGTMFVTNDIQTDSTTSRVTEIFTQFDFSNVIIHTGGYVRLYIYDITTGSFIANFYLDIQSICFKEGTKILCMIDKREQYVAIENIKENTFVKIYNKSGKGGHYKKAKFIVKSALENSSESTINKLYRIKKERHSNLIEDLYVTGSHALLYDELTDMEYEKMSRLVDHYNTYTIRLENEENMSAEEVENTKSLMKYYNDYKMELDDKYKLIAYFDDRFEEINDEGVFNIYHIVLENANKYDNYGIWANGILAESTCEVSLSRFPGYEKVNFNRVTNGLTKLKREKENINDKLQRYLNRGDDKVVKMVEQEIKERKFTYKRASLMRKNKTYKKC